MNKSLLDCEEIGSNDDVNIVFQIGKLGSYSTNDVDNWSDIRRYYVNKGANHQKSKLFAVKL